MERELLSPGGRITLTNAVLSAIPMYFLSFCPQPRWEEKEIDSMKRRFLGGDTRRSKGLLFGKLKAGVQTPGVQRFRSH